MAIRLMNKVWDQASMDPTDKLVLLCLADHADCEGQFSVDIVRIAGRCNLGHKATVHALDRLEENGWISTLKEDGDLTLDRCQINLDRLDRLGPFD